MDMNYDMFFFSVSLWDGFNYLRQPDSYLEPKWINLGNRIFCPKQNKNIKFSIDCLLSLVNCLSEGVSQMLCILICWNKYIKKVVWNCSKSLEKQAMTGHQYYNYIRWQKLSHIYIYLNSSSSSSEIFFPLFGCNSSTYFKWAMLILIWEPVGIFNVDVLNTHPQMLVNCMFL